MKLKVSKKKLFECSLYSAVIAIGILLDQLTKLLAVKFLKGEPSIPIINGVLRLTYVENRGAAFGMLKDDRWIFMTASTITLIVMLAILFFAKDQRKLLTFSLATVISGGIGNMIDRVALGYVVDFIDFYLIDFAVFNFADSLVCVGAGFLMLAVILDLIEEIKKARKEKLEKEGKEK